MRKQSEVELVRITPCAEELIANARWTCQGNEKTNPTRNEVVRSINAAFSAGHMSVFEHASVTFVVKTSRVTSHQLVRHRTFTFSQRSQRAMSQTEVPLVMPNTVREALKKDHVTAAYVDGGLFRLQKAYKELTSDLKVPKEDARYILPHGNETVVMMSSDFRNWLHFLRLRLHPSAQWEIRDIAEQVLRQLQDRCPTIFNLDQIKNLKYVPDWNE